MLLLLLPAILAAQPYELSIEISDAPERQWPKKEAFSDSLSVQKKVSDYLRALRADGHWGALINSADWTKNQLRLTVAKGPVIRWADITWDTTQNWILTKDPKLHRWSGQKLKGSQWLKWQQTLLETAENNGYPFARLEWKELEFQSDSLSGSLSFIPGPLILIDSINIRGYDQITEQMVANALGIKVGMPYSEKALRNIPAEIRDIEYLSMPRRPQVLFNKEKTVVFIYVEKEKANQFDGILGFNATEEKLTLTGNVYLRLLNTFNRGEELVLDWSSPGNTTQKLNIKGAYPFLFGWPWAIEGMLDLVKQDSSFLNLESQIGLRYFLSTRSSVSFSVLNKSSSRLAEETTEAVQDFNSVFYQGGFEWRTTDRRISPRQGQRFSLMSSIGERTRENSKATQIRGTLDFRNYWHFSRQWVLVNRIQAGVLSQDVLNNAPQQQFINELFRFGGILTLRGFDEQSLLLSNYQIGTAEIRLLSGQQSYFLAFVDFGRIQSLATQNAFENSVLGLGVGGAFSTPAGLLNLTYALGQRDNAGFQFNQAKVHIGLINSF